MPHYRNRFPQLRIATGTHPGSNGTVTRFATRVLVAYRRPAANWVLWPRVRWFPRSHLDWRVLKTMNRRTFISGVAGAAGMSWAAWPSRGGTAPPATDATFPLRVSDDGRHLVDAKGKPFFYHADTPWMLLRLKPDAARDYLDDRRARGFTALQVQLTGFMDMRDHAGETPFLGDHDLGRPNEAYFAHADALLRDATDRGFLLAVAPLWSGCCGEGWAGAEKDGRPKPLDAAGPEAARHLGRWVGERYAKFPNILWVMGGDHDPERSFDAIDALAGGIHEAAPGHLMTAHNTPDHSSADFYNGSPWLTLNAAYSYRELAAPVFREWGRAGKVRPVFLSESGYEHEANDKRPGTPFRLRRQAYAAVLNGALAGHAYGHRDIWTFAPRWREALDDIGARQMAHVKALFATRPWWALVPDQGDAFVTAGRGNLGEDGYVSAARSDDGTLAILYLPEGRPVTLDISRLRPERGITARWFDPTDGQLAPAEGSPVRADGPRPFAPPPKNGAGERDFVLILEGGA